MAVKFSFDADQHVATVASIGNALVQLQQLWFYILFLSNEDEYFSDDNDKRSLSELFVRDFLYKDPILQRLEILAHAAWSWDWRLKSILA
jgi:hypothetical protein